MTKFSLLLAIFFCSQLTVFSTLALPVIEESSNNVENQKIFVDETVANAGESLTIEKEENIPIQSSEQQSNI